MLRKIVEIRRRNLKEKVEEAPSRVGNQNMRKGRGRGGGKLESAGVWRNSARWIV